MPDVDADEREILAAFEKGSLKSVATKAELAKFKAAAMATAVKDRRVDSPVIECHAPINFPPMKTAILVIDMQQGLCEGEGKAFDCEGVITRINLVTRKARDAGAPVIFIQHESTSGYLEYGTAAWQLATGLEVVTTDLRIRKTTPDSFLRTDLEGLLRDHGVKNVVVCGMHTEFCVDTTTRRALALGYPVTLVEDAHTSAGNVALTPQQVIQHHNATLTNISSFGPRVTAISSEALSIAG